MTESPEDLLQASIAAWAVTWKHEFNIDDPDLFAQLAIDYILEELLEPV